LTLELAGIVKAFGTARAVDAVDLRVDAGEFFTLLGPSGCGKTTLLRAVAGIYPIDAGTVMLNGRDITGVPMHRRNMAMVFQSYALFPHLTAFDNVAFGLKSRGVGAAELRRRVEEALALVKLEALARRHPAQMSGGQQQRVALARALVVRPDLLLLDEPLSNLDARLRDEMRFEIRELQRRFGITTILVTHDIDEAFTMADRIGVMQHGRIVQVGSPAEIYHRPASRFVANFVGPINEFVLSEVSVQGGRTRALAGGELAVWLHGDAAGLAGQGEARLILRPEHLRINAADAEVDNSFPAEIEDVVFLGGGTQCVLRLGAWRMQASLPSAAAAGLSKGARVTVGWRAADAAVTVG